MTNKKSKKSVSAAIVPEMSSADLLTAGVADFKLTKDDLIDLLVDEAETTLRAEVAIAEAAYNAADAELTAAHEAHSEERERLHINLYAAEIAALRKLFAPDIQMEARGNFSGVNVVFHTGDVPRKVLLDVDLAASSRHSTFAQELQPFADRLKIARQVCTDANDKLHEARARLRELRTSSKKLRTQLIRKVLSSNTNGENILANVKNLSQQFLASLGAGV